MDTSELLLNGFGAFAGAFFAFLFLRLGEFLTKVYERQVKHYNSLVNLEVQLNEIGGIIHDDLYILPPFIKTIKLGHVYFNNLHTLKIDRNHYENLCNLALLNELFSYNYQIRKINDDIETMSSGYQDIKNALIQRNITPQEYKVNADVLSENLEYIRLFLVNFQEKTINLIARIRIHIKHDQPLGARLMRPFISAVRYKLKEEDIKKETKMLKLEIEESVKKSSADIKKILS
ncbi:MAG: hypothetical protein UX10_C0029G0009 [Candidatus Magasanikbacteria bacterium GW2011_GWA2_45_39]|uniref:Uncharacterized protein n=1 Tax=Candidatus Magasanikbacteria bacterium GW2011_GWA2_45_39 TaxID=1619041 RepID=A0A0G1ME54_9BACT|nr:MAG: hypothetical protein UX10_C0029G0009 [Candidatus Magasanikbacteria bacterium GW2011_GWA2_45_39]